MIKKVSIILLIILCIVGGIVVPCINSNFSSVTITFDDKFKCCDSYGEA